MATVTYPLGTPRLASARGGDCRAYDVDQARNVYGPHVFALPSHAQITNGLMRLTVGSAGTTPALTVAAFRPAVTIGDYYSDTYSDTYDGTLSTSAWIAMGQITIDSPAVAESLEGVRLIRISPEAVTVELLSAGIGDAYVTLRRGFRSVGIQHGRTRPLVVTTTRRVRWVGPPALVGTAVAGRVEEQIPTVEGFARFVGGLDAVTADAGAFAVTTASVLSARFAAGIGIDAPFDHISDHHAQAADATVPHLVLAVS